MGTSELIGFINFESPNPPEPSKLKKWFTPYLGIVVLPCLEMVERLPSYKLTYTPPQDLSSIPLLATRIKSGHNPAGDVQGLIREEMDSTPKGAEGITQHEYA